jgi:hypothetical protein
MSLNSSPSLLDDMMFSVRPETVLVEAASGRRVPRVGSLALADLEQKTIAIAGTASTTARVVSVSAEEAATCSVRLLNDGALDGDLVSLRITALAGATVSIYDVSGAAICDPVSSGGATRIETIDLRFVGGNWIVWHRTVLESGVT